MKSILLLVVLGLGCAHATHQQQLGGGAIGNGLRQNTHRLSYADGTRDKAMIEAKKRCHPQKVNILREKGKSIHFDCR